MTMRDADPDSGGQPHLHPAPWNDGPLREQLAVLYQCRAAIGSLPASPPTLRARVGIFLVATVRRALFWLLPQLDRFHAASIDMAQEQINAIEQLLDAHRRLDAALGRALEEFAARHAVLEADVAALRAEILAARLPVYLAALPEGGRGVVLDVGCGESAWLRLLREAEVPAEEVIAGEALRRLAALPAASLRGLTVSTLPPEPAGIAPLLDEAMRVLQPGAPILAAAPEPSAAPALERRVRDRGFVDVSVQSGAVLGRKPR